MPGMQVSYTFYTPTIVTAQPTEDANFPRARLWNPKYPLRHSKSTGVGVDQYYVLDLGSNQTGTLWVACADANYASVRIAAGNSATYNDASFTANETLHSLTLDPWVKRYKGVFSHTFSANRYLRWRIITQATTDGTTQFATGVLYVFNNTNLITLTKQFVDPASVSIMSRYRENTFGIIRQDDFYITFDASVGLITSADINEWRNLATIGADSPLLLQFNRGINAEFFPMMFEPDPNFQIKTVQYGSSWKFKEITFGR